MTKMPEHSPQLVTIQNSKRKALAQGQAIVSEDFVALTRLDNGEKWLSEWVNSPARFDAQELVVVTANRDKNRLIEGFLSLYYFNEAGVIPAAKGWERFVAILRNNDRPFEGSFAYRIWKASQTDEPVWYAEECLIYSDVSFAGELQALGPFDIKNNLPADADTMASLTVRYRLYRSANDFDYTFRQLLHTHPRYAEYRERILIPIADELACLISVATGRRLIGDSVASRWFGLSPDPLGEARDPGPRPKIQAQRHRSILPYYFSRERDNLATAEPVLRQYFSLSAPLAARFLRAAVLYKKALLQSDLEPDLAWIWGVGAIEALAEVPGDHAGALNRFVRFLIAHLPPPPPVRPPRGELTWDSSLKKSFEQIYAYRSDFLHAGHQFPSPMSRPPENLSAFFRKEEISGAEVFSERPRGGIGIGPTRYESEACPMQLHVFLYIVQGCLLKWLDLTSKAESAAAPTLPVSSRLEVTITPAADRIRVVVVDEDQTVVQDEKLPKADLLSSTLMNILPSGYEVSEIVLLRTSEVPAGAPASENLAESVTLPKEGDAPGDGGREGASNM
ncbi:hypothetical protein [Nannocystis pusilla]|uniref:Apea-like HEPN domain-containing protein n=1 Tax=Nannocystis pusilla TaxID=889268 RepID=A0ABS7TN74_9BACT|nr:hypothetical protein [Nannocystis pusilla]MBZ5709645.1 hypothetical protein [Nannocystis pusilla]